MVLNQENREENDFKKFKIFYSFHPIFLTAVLINQKKKLFAFLSFHLLIHEPNRALESKPYSKMKFCFLPSAILEAHSSGRLVWMGKTKATGIW